MEDTLAKLDALLKEVVSLRTTVQNLQEKVESPDDMWSAKRVGQHLGGKSVKHVMRLLREQEKTGFPSPRRYPSFDGGVERISQRLWDPKEVKLWVSRQPKENPSLQPVKKRSRCSNEAASSGLCDPSLVQGQERASLEQSV